MRNLVIVAAMGLALGLGGALMWQANAAGAAGAVPHDLSGPMSMRPIHPAACNGRTGEHGCGAGFIWECNGAGNCRCVRC
jgi:hypothetical protein